MIIVYHNSKSIIKIQIDNIDFNNYNNLNLKKGLERIVDAHLFDKLVWCHIDLEKHVNLEFINGLLVNDYTFYSYNTNENSKFEKYIGYVDLNINLKNNKNVQYATWLLSDNIGVMSYNLLKIFIREFKEKNFDFALKSFAKRFIKEGLFCYSEPHLLITNKKNNCIKIEDNNNFIFEFTAKHYKKNWLFILIFSLIRYENKWPVFSFIKGIFSIKYKNFIPLNFNDNILNSSINLNHETIDVLIPTIGRKKYLYDVLNDLKNQSNLPTRVIIIEQNPLENSVSELDYIQFESWPFEILHKFTHQTGACNARNIGLNLIKSKWTFFADDDIRIPNDFLEKGLKQILNNKHQAVSFYCDKEFDRKVKFKPTHWNGFGSGCSIVASDCLKNCTFGKAFEFGFGEDGDFGMQLRNKGVDIIYYNSPQLQHLKAPIGGFRTKPILRWKNEKYQPKPSPTVMLYKIKHTSIEQIRTFKLDLFLKYYKHQNIKNPITYYFVFKKQWETSYKWAVKLENENI